MPTFCQVESRRPLRDVTARTTAPNGRVILMSGLHEPKPRRAISPRELLDAPSLALVVQGVADDLVRPRANERRDVLLPKLPGHAEIAVCAIQRSFLPADAVGHPPGHMSHTLLDDGGLGRG